MRPFVETLAEIRGGACLEDLAKRLAELVAEIEAAGTGGALILSLEIKPMERAEAALLIRDSITVKRPKRQSSGTVLFAGPGGTLSRSHPKQTELGLGQDLGQDKAQAPASSSAVVSINQPARTAP